MDMLKDTFRGWAVRQEFHAALAELSRFTDRQLADIGLERGDLARVALEEAERRVGAPASPRDVAADSALWPRPFTAVAK
ncbi:MAG: DUF1127 domain-containing protein [Geminicoccaceae bacterium]